MSFMVIRGKAYHCNTCEKEVKVEYEGGAKVTQLGDEYVKIQQELNEKYTSEDYDGEKEGYYFHIEGLMCQDCFNKSHRVEGDTNLLQEDSPMDDVSEIIDSYKDEIDTIIEDILPDIFTGIEFKDLGYLDEKRFNEIVNSDFFEIASKRTELIEEFIFDNSDEINDHILTKIQEHDDVISLNRKYREETMEIKKSLLDLSEKVKGGFFQEQDVYEVDVLNPVLANDNTTKYPVKSDLAYKFYSGPYELSMTNLEELTENADILDLLDQSETHFGYEIDKLKERLIREMA